MGYRIGIQILSYNKPKYLVQVLESLMQSKSDTDKIMVFEQSDDEKVREEGLNICRKFNDVQCIVSTENLGQRGATNKVIQSGFFDDCEYVMLTDHDNIFHEQLDIYVNKLNHSPSIWVATGYNSPEHDIEDKDDDWLLKTTARAGHMTFRQVDFMSMTPIDEKAGLDNGCSWFCGLDWWLTHWCPQAPGLRRPKIIAAFPGGVEHAGRESTWQGAYDDEYTVEENLKFRESTMEEILTFYKPRHAYQKGKYWYETTPPKTMVKTTTISDDTSVKDLFKNLFNKDVSDTEISTISKFIESDKLEYDEVFTDGIIAFNYIWPNYGYRFLELSIRSVLPYVTKYVIYINKYSYVGKACPDENIQWVNDIIADINSDKIVVHYKDDPEFPEYAKQDNIAYYFLKCISEYSRQSEYVMLVQSDEIYDEDNINKVIECKLDDGVDGAIFQPWCYMDTPQWRVDPPEGLTRPTLVRNKADVDLALKIERLDIAFHHYSYVLMQDELLIKFSNWGHRDDVNVTQYTKLFDDLKSDKHLTDLHPIYGPVYKSVKFDGTPLAKATFKYWLKNNCNTYIDVVKFAVANLLSDQSNVVCYEANDIGLSNIDYGTASITAITNDYDLYLDNSFIHGVSLYGSMIDGLQHIMVETADLVIYHAEGDVEPLQNDLINMYLKLKNFGWGCVVYRNDSQFEMLLRMILRNGHINDADGQIFNLQFNEITYSSLPDSEYNVCLFRVNLDNKQLMAIDSDKVIFGPFIGEFGWELTRWAPMVNEFKRNNPKANIVVATHKDSFGLYQDCETYHIEVPDIGRDGFRNKTVPPNEYGLLLSSLNKSYPKHNIITPLEFDPVLNVFSWKDRFIGYSDTDMIEKGFAVFVGDRIPIAISSRYILGKARNWTHDNWLKFYQLISDSDKYFGIVVGKSPTIFKADNMSNILYAENYVDDKYNMIDTMIGAMRIATLTIGQQSSLPILSQFIETPTLMFGHRKYRNMNFDNPKGVRKMFIENPNYDITPEELYNAMDKFVMKLKG